MKNLILIFFIFLASCAPAVQEVTATPAPTSTPLPTATAIPTPTLNPAFLALQDQFAQTENYTLQDNGTIEAKQPDGTPATVKGIRLNADGTSYTIMVNGTPVTIEAGKVSLTDENGINVTGYSYTDEGDFSEILTYTPEQLAEMTPEQIAALAPPTSPDGYTNGGISTLEGKSNIVKYYDTNGKLRLTFDLTTGEYKNLAQAEIVELARTDGTYYEMPGFMFTEDVSKMEPWQVQNLKYDLVLKAVNHILDDGVDWGNPANETVGNSSPENNDFVANVKIIVGIKPIGGAMIPLNKQNSPDDTFKIVFGTLNQPGYEGTNITYVNSADHVRRIIFVQLPISDVQSIVYSMNIEKR